MLARRGLECQNACAELQRTSLPLLRQLGHVGQGLVKKGWGIVSRGTDNPMQMTPELLESWEVS